MADDKMTHADIIRKIADETQITQKYVKEVLEAAVALVRQEMLAGRDFKLLYIGTFKPVTRQPRTYHSPIDGKTVKKPATNAVKFKIARDLKRALNG
jgi:DNA-binding protein HU-beta